MTAGIRCARPTCLGKGDSLGLVAEKRFAEDLALILRPIGMKASRLSTNAIDLARRIADELMASRPSESLCRENPWHRQAEPR
jgi:hypothetical protein